jgi:hypothetical protein
MGLVYGRLEGDEVATEVELVGVRGVAGEDLKGVGAGESVVFLEGDVEDVVAADVHNDDVSGGDEAEAVGAGGEGFAVDAEGGLGEEVGLVGLLDGGGVAGGVDECGEDELATGNADAGGVAALDGGGLAAEEDGGRKDGGGLGAVEDAGFGRRGGGGLRSEGLRGVGGGVGDEQGEGEKRGEANVHGSLSYGLGV